MIDAAGRSAAFTGADGIDWAGHVIGDGVSVAGNMLAGPRVVEATLRAYEDNGDLPLAERLLAAMEAGERERGDKRGRQSAATRLVRGHANPWLHLRPAAHGDPLAPPPRLLRVPRGRHLL